MKKYRLLMLTTLLISGCSICYELIISAVSSYLMGDSVCLLYTSRRREGSVPLPDLPGLIPDRDWGERRIRDSRF